MLQTCFAIFQNLNKQWDMATINNIFIRCVILHNLIIEDESNCNLKPLCDVGSNVWHDGLFVEDYYKITIEIENVIANYNFKNDLVEHLWI
jgi:hypothetical protein